MYKCDFLEGETSWRSRLFFLCSKSQRLAYNVLWKYCHHWFWLVSSSKHSHFPFFFWNFNIIALLRWQRVSSGTLRVTTQASREYTYRSEEGGKKKMLPNIYVVDQIENISVSERTSLFDRQRIRSIYVFFLP